MHTGLRVSPDYWVQQERRAKNSYRSGITIGSDINRELSSIETFVVDVLRQYRLERSTPLPNSPKHQFGRYFGSVLDNNDADIYDCIDIFTDTMSHQIGGTPCTLTKFRTIKKAPPDFLAQTHYCRPHRRRPAVFHVPPTQSSRSPK